MGVPLQGTEGHILRIPQTILAIVCAVIGSFITAAFVSGSTVQKISNSETRIMKSEYKIERLEQFLIDSSTFQAETRANLNYIKEQLNDIHLSRRSNPQSK